MCNFTGAVTYTLTFQSAHLQKKSLFQEAAQYLDFFMLLLDVFSATMMTSSSKFKQQGVILNLGYAPAVIFFKIVWKD